MFLIYELFLGLSRGEETFVFGKCYGFTHERINHKGSFVMRLESCCE